MGKEIWILQLVSIVLLTGFFYLVEGNQSGTVFNANRNDYSGDNFFNHKPFVDEDDEIRKTNKQIIKDSKIKRRDPTGRSNEKGFYDSTGRLSKEQFDAKVSYIKAEEAKRIGKPTLKEKILDMARVPKRQPKEYYHFCSLLD